MQLIEISFVGGEKEGDATYWTGWEDDGRGEYGIKSGSLGFNFKQSEVIEKSCILFEEQQVHWIDCSRIFVYFFT